MTEKMELDQLSLSRVNRMEQLDRQVHRRRLLTARGAAKKLMQLYRQKYGLPTVEDGEET